MFSRPLKEGLFESMLTYDYETIYQYKICEAGETMYIFNIEQVATLPKQLKPL